MINSSIKRKMTILIFLCALIPLLALSVLIYYKSADVVNRQLRDYNSYAIEQLQTVTDMHLREMDSLSRDIQSYLLAPGRKITSEPRTYAEYLELNSFLDFLSFHVSGIVEGLFVYTPDGEVISSRSINRAALVNAGWWTATMDEPAWQWAGFHDGSHYNSPQPAGPLISLIVPVQLKAGVPQGSRIVVDVNARAMTGLFRSFEEDTNAYLEIADAKGRFIYRTEGEPPPSGSEYVFSELMELNGWEITARLPLREFNRSARVVRNYAFLIAGLSLVAAFLMARLLSGNLSQRIIGIDRSMLAFSKGKLDTKVDVRGNDELARLASRFNFMTEQIRSLIENIGRTESLKKEAELRALHYQINPHLILNTLNSIQWRARMAGRTDIDRMIFHLGALLSENLAISQELVTLEEELTTIHHYLKIQYYRYGDAFVYEEDVEPGLELLLIPRMTLQPLFENVFYHAFDDGAGHIALEAYRDRQHAVLRLSDDGKGFGGQADAIRPSPPRKGRGGLGLYNVDQKLKLHFGEHYGVRVVPDGTTGTTIELRWPYREKEDDDDEAEKRADRG